MKNKKHKVVINNCFGCFGLSLECVQVMAKMGHTKAIEILNEEKSLPIWMLKQVENECFWPDELYDCRHDPILIKAIEEIGTERASKSHTELLVTEIDGNQYVITEYDGWESVATPSSTQWIVIK